jgi:hypothetical protein
MGLRDSAMSIFFCCSWTVKDKAWFRIFCVIKWATQNQTFPLDRNATEHHWLMFWIHYGFLQIAYNSMFGKSLQMHPEKCPASLFNSFYPACRRWVKPASSIFLLKYCERVGEPLKKLTIFWAWPNIFFTGRMEHALATTRFKRWLEKWQSQPIAHKILRLYRILSLLKWSACSSILFVFPDITFWKCDNHSMELRWTKEFFCGRLAFL